MAVSSILLLLLLLPIPLYLGALVFFLNPNRSHGKGTPPPSPPPIPILGNLWLTKSFSRLGHVLCRLKAIYGPIFTLYIGRSPAVFIMDRTLAHHALVRKGVAFAHRPPPLSTAHALSGNLRTINMAAYGPYWRLLRRALSAGVFHPSQLSLQADARAWALDALVDELVARAKAGGGVVKPSESFQLFSFRLFTLLCFGEKLDEGLISSMREAQMDTLDLAVMLRVYNLVPKILLVMFLGRWKKFLCIRRRLHDLFAPLIRARQQLRQSHGDTAAKLTSYLDSLLDLKHVEQGGRTLTEEEIVSLCSEFLSASADTTSTAVEWIIANLVIHQDMQEKLYEEIKSVMGGTQRATIEENDIRRMPYLKAVVLEGLRRHPPVHLLLPHTVVEDTAVDGYVIPRGAIVNCSVAEVGRDGEVWAESMEFRPERFLGGGEGEGVDLMGSLEIKMMPFGAGRRMCPGMGISVLLVEYLVANMVSRFRWEGVEGEEVDMTEEPGLTVGMKNPFRARIVPRGST
ncbi:Cytochrome P450 [Canna indica]|uniref:Cytochrome P450 n=1 Tax=Canna indica TaxID=4628 RepID=A0AAQ3QNY1_9LILI|nr:Cytochrome P450 [Canna indica]